MREGEAGRGGDREDQPGDQSLELAGSVEGHHAGPDSVLGCSKAGQPQLAVLVSGGEDRGSLLGPAHLLGPDQPLLPPQPDLAPPLPTRAQPHTQQPRPWCWAGEDDLATRHHAVHQPVHRGRQTETSHHMDCSLDPLTFDESPQAVRSAADKSGANIWLSLSSCPPVLTRLPSP